MRSTTRVDDYFVSVSVRYDQYVILSRCGVPVDRSIFLSVYYVVRLGWEII